LDSESVSGAVFGEKERQLEFPQADRQTLLEQVAQRKAPDGTDWNEWLASAWMELTDSAQVAKRFSSIL